MKKSQGNREWDTSEVYASNRKNLYNSHKNSTQSKKNKNESLISNPETNPMNPVNDKE